jgi:hypothetical protein
MSRAIILKYVVVAALATPPKDILSSLSIRMSPAFNDCRQTFRLDVVSRSTPCGRIVLTVERERQRKLQGRRPFLVLAGRHERLS